MDATFNRRAALPLLAAGFGLLPAIARAESKPHRLALQISDNSADKMNAVLNVAANVTRYYGDKGEEIEVQVVAFNAGLHMLRDDTSPVKERMASFRKSMPNVEFKACANTRAGMERAEGHPIPLQPGIPTVDSGVTHLMDLSEKGWTVIRP